MKHNNSFYLSIFCFLFGTVLASCSTTEYIRDSYQLYENDVLQAESATLKKGDKVVDTSSKYYHTTQIDDIKISTTTLKTSDSKYETMHIQLYNSDNNLLAEKDILTLNGNYEKDSNLKTYITDEEFTELTGKSINEFFMDGFNQTNEEVAAATAEDKDGETLKAVESMENIKVESKLNKSFITYQVLGKPCVIAGATTWNLLKCSGYAVVNFIAGYSATTGGGVSWLMPDVKGAKTKAAEAKEANRVKTYPEFHVSGTNNHITVNSLKTETSNVFSEENKQVKVVSEDKFEYDNTLSVNLSAKADANQTASTVGVIGTIITVPVSVVSWIGGAAYGIYAQTTK